jgi:hypothetical protein
MNGEKQNEEPKAQPSEGPAKNEPTPERAREEKEKQEREACRDSG